MDLFMVSGFAGRDQIFIVAFNEYEAWDYLKEQHGLDFFRSRFPIMRKLDENECVEVNNTEMGVGVYISYWPSEGIVEEEMQLCL